MAVAPTSNFMVRHKVALKSSTTLNRAKLGADDPDVIQAALAIEPSASYPDRDGYDPSFLGPELPMPHLAPAQKTLAAPLKSDPTKSELKYTHFSVVMNKMRRLPFMTAVNIDGSQLKSIKRGSDKWSTDDRIARTHQLGNEAYKANDLDRGHMVRRLDPVWGKDAQQANDDTFVYTNSALQHKNLNRKEWVALESHILKHAQTSDDKLTVMTGPVFRDDDPVFDNDGRVSPPTQIPQQFWKVAVWNNPQEGLEGAAFVLNQSEFIEESEARDGKFDPGRFDVYQVPISELEKMLQMKFGEIDEVTNYGQKIETPEQVFL